MTHYDKKELDNKIREVYLKQQDMLWNSTIEQSLNEFLETSTTYAIPKGTLTSVLKGRRWQERITDKEVVYMKNDMMTDEDAMNKCGLDQSYLATRYVFQLPANKLELICLCVKRDHVTVNGWWTH